MSASSGMCDLEVCHEPVNDVGGRFKGRFSQLGIDHGGLGIGMPQDLLDEIAATQPLSVVMSEQISALRHWAMQRCVKA